MNNVLIPKDCDFLEISVFFSGTLKGRKSALASGIPSIVVFRREVQPTAQQAWLDGGIKERLCIAYCLQWFWQHDSEGNLNKVISLFRLS